MSVWKKMFGMGKKEDQTSVEIQNKPILNQACGKCGKSDAKLNFCKLCGKNICLHCTWVADDPEIHKKYGGIVGVCSICQTPLYMLTKK